MKIAWFIGLVACLTACGESPCWDSPHACWQQRFERKCKPDKAAWMLECIRSGGDSCDYLADKELCWWEPRPGVDARKACLEVTSETYCPSAYIAPRADEIARDDDRGTAPDPVECPLGSHVDHFAHRCVRDAVPHGTSTEPASRGPRVGISSKGRLGINSNKGLGLHIDHKGRVGLGWGL